MKERPILFSGPMVRALLDGSKTQTRRVVKPQPYIDEQGNFCWNGSNFGQDGKGPHTQAIASPIPSSKTKRVHCPYGKPGDRLWVRETFAHIYRDNATPDQRRDGDVAYKADHQGLDEYAYGTWKSSIHMPRWASRITLEVTGVRVERLQGISEADAMAEGVAETAKYLQGLSACLEHCYAYEDLWESINGAGSWDANPWVWVVNFKAEGGAA